MRVIKWSFDKVLTELMTEWLPMGYMLDYVMCRENGSTIRFVILLVQIEDELWVATLC